MSIPPVLYQALLDEMQSADKGIWIDQDNDDEKLYAIATMDIIYKRARCVFALTNIDADDEEITALQFLTQSLETSDVAGNGTWPNKGEVPPYMSSHPPLLRLVEKILCAD